VDILFEKEDITLVGKKVLLLKKEENKL